MSIEKTHLKKEGYINKSINKINKRNFLRAMLRTRKANLAFNIIIVAIIAIIVLFIVLGIFSSKTGKVNDELNKCITSGGVCIDNNKFECKGIVDEASCSEGHVCCKGLYVSKENQEDSEQDGSESS